MKTQTKFVRTLTRHPHDDYTDSHGEYFLCIIAASLYFGATPRRLRMEVRTTQPHGDDWRAANLFGVHAHDVQVGWNYHATYSAMRVFLRAVCGIQRDQTFWFRLVKV